jgi:hypothetical protein
MVADFEFEENNLSGRTPGMLLMIPRCHIIIIMIGLKIVFTV